MHFRARLQPYTLYVDLVNQNWMTDKLIEYIVLFDPRGDSGSHNISVKILLKRYKLEVLSLL